MTRIPNIAAVLLLASMLTGCQVVADIFQAGVWVGVLISVAVLALLFWLVMRIFR